MSLKLNDEQRKLVEQNHNLIYSAMTKCGIRRQDFDDYYVSLLLGCVRQQLIMMNPKLNHSLHMHINVCKKKL